jgi:hypothetical protein
MLGWLFGEQEGEGGSAPKKASFADEAGGYGERKQQPAREHNPNVSAVRMCSKAQGCTAHLRPRPRPHACSFLSPICASPDSRSMP